jgi:putative sigma-54 modulation protein
MKYVFVGKNIEVGSRLKERLVKKVGKLDKFFNPDTEATATFSIIRSQHILELTIMQNGILFRAEEHSDDMYISIDKVVDVIERQIRKNKTRLARRFHGNAFLNEGYEDTSYILEERDYDIARVKKFQVKPMTIDEAILQMNLLGHMFFVFINSDSKQVNVVYKRKDESYGLIEPEY